MNRRYVARFKIAFTCFELGFRLCFRAVLDIASITAIRYIVACKLILQEAGLISGDQMIKHVDLLFYPLPYIGIGDEDR